MFLFRVLFLLILAVSSAELQQHPLRALARASSALLADAVASGAAVTCPCTDTSLCAPVPGPAVAEREIYGFGGADGSGLDWSRVTTVAWAGDDRLTCTAHSHGAKVIMSAPKPEEALTADASIRSAWIAKAVAAVVAGFMDGLVFDWEEPCKVGAPEQHWYSVLIDETREALQGISSSYQVSTCVAWSPDNIDGRGYDVVAFANASDLLYVMDYDTRSQVWDACIAAANAPTPGTIHGVSRYLDLGIPASKLVLGVPWYGYRYPCVAGTPSTARFCPIPFVPFRGVNCSDAAGSEIAYDELVLKLSASITGRLWDEGQGAPYFNTVENNVTVQYWYDDAQSLVPKYKFARSAGLRGVGPFTFTDVTDTRMYEALDAFLLPKAQDATTKPEIIT